MKSTICQDIAHCMFVSCVFYSSHKHQCIHVGLKRGVKSFDLLQKGGQKSFKGFHRGCQKVWLPKFPSAQAPSHQSNYEHSLKPLFHNQTTAKSCQSNAVPTKKHTPYGMLNINFYIMPSEMGMDFTWNISGIEPLDDFRICPQPLTPQNTWGVGAKSAKFHQQSMTIFFNDSGALVIPCGHAIRSRGHEVIMQWWVPQSRLLSWLLISQSEPVNIYHLTLINLRQRLR